MSTPRHFLTLDDLSNDELHEIVNNALAMKTAERRTQTLSGHMLGMLFQKPSTRTRLSFESGMRQLGGEVIFISAAEAQTSRGESPEDTARVMSALLDIIVLRVSEHDYIERFASYSSAPVINGLSGRFHPCQLLADIMTFVELRGSIAGKTVTWLGDGNNVCQSYIKAAQLFDFELRIAAPEHFEPEPELLEKHRNWARIVRDPMEAARGAHLLVTDVWTSMSDQPRDIRALEPYQLNRAKLEIAAEDALYMHCLPAHRDQELSAELLDDPHTVIWREAENRMHAQKALLKFLLA